MKCPYCKGSLGMFGSKALTAAQADPQANPQANAGETKNAVKDHCPHCSRRFALGTSRAVLIMVSLPLVVLSFLFTSGMLMHALGMGLAFGLGTAVAMRAEPLNEAGVGEAAR